MTKDQMLEGLTAGRTLIQEEWADRREIQAADELIAAGLAVATAWEWKGNYQCERRRITSPPAPPHEASHSQEGSP